MDDEENSALKSDRKIPTGELLRKTWPYLKKEWLSLTIAFVILVANVVAGIFIPKIEEEILSVIKTDNFVLKTAILLTVAFFALALFRAVLAFVDQFVLSKAGERIVFRLRQEVYHHIESMSQNQLGEMPVGSLVTRVANYTTSISNLFVGVIVSLLINVLTVIGVLVMMITISPLMALVVFGFLALIFVISFFFTKKIRVVYREARTHVSSINAYLAESLSGMKIIQIFNAELKKQNDFNERNEALRKARYTVVKLFGIYRPLLMLIFVICAGVTFMLAPILSFTSPMLFVFYVYEGEFFNPVQSIADQLNNIQDGLSGLEKIFNLLAIKPEVIDAPDAIELGEVKGEIEFKDVWFAYHEERWILRGASFKIDAKSTCAFVGATGAGKTTILGLIARNFEPQKGVITLDGIPLNHIKIDSLRTKLGQMLQDVFLFSGTVKDNITLFDESFSKEAIDDASSYVNAKGFIDAMPNGYDTILAERGENLSQGQRQLLSFARTVLHQPSILILDEATANIDTETEALIQESLEKMKSIGTMLVVAHRLSTIQKADRIVVLDHGEVAEVGNHRQLLQKRGLYYKLYKLQFTEK